MPRCWSAAALARRRARAFQRGFIVPHSSPGKKFVETDVRLANTVRLMARSVELHAQHDKVTGSRHHFARCATAATRHILPEPEVNRALRAHRLANSAKHDVRLPPGAEPRALAAPSGAAKRPRSQWADLADDADPWAGSGDPWSAAAAAQRARCSEILRLVDSPPPSGEVRLPPPVEAALPSRSLDPEAADFVPAGFSPQNPFEVMMELINAQNATIALLMGALERLQGDLVASVGIAPRPASPPVCGADPPGLRPSLLALRDELVAEVSSSHSEFAGRVLDSVQALVSRIDQEWETAACLPRSPVMPPKVPSSGGSAVTSSTPIPRAGSASRPAAGSAASWRARSSSSTSSSGEDEGTGMPELVPPFWCSACRVALCCPTCEECILCDKCHCDDACLAQPSEPPD